MSISASVTGTASFGMLSVSVVIVNAGSPPGEPVAIGGLETGAGVEVDGAEVGGLSINVRTLPSTMGYSFTSFESTNALPLSKRR